MEQTTLVLRVDVPEEPHIVLFFLAGKNPQHKTHQLLTKFSYLWLIPRYLSDQFSSFLYVISVCILHFIPFLRKNQFGVYFLFLIFLSYQHNAVFGFGG